MKKDNFEIVIGQTRDTVGRWLNLLRDKGSLFLSQGDLAAEIGISRGTLRRVLLSPESRISLKTLHLIKKYFVEREELRALYGEEMIRGEKVRPPKVGDVVWINKAEGWKLVLSRYENGKPIWSEYENGKLILERAFGIERVC